MSIYNIAVPFNPVEGIISIRIAIGHQKCVYYYSNQVRHTLSLFSLIASGAALASMPANRPSYLRTTTLLGHTIGTGSNWSRGVIVQVSNNW